MSEKFNFKKSLAVRFAAVALVLPLVGCATHPAQPNIQTLPNQGYVEQPSAEQVRQARLKFLDAVIDYGAYEPEKVINGVDSLLSKHSGAEGELLSRFKSCLAQSTAAPIDQRSHYVHECTGLNRPFGK